MLTPKSADRYAVFRLHLRHRPDQDANPHGYASATGSNDNGGVTGYELATGQEKWKWTGDGPGYASPVPLTVGGKRLVVVETDKKIVALDPGDGKLVWETPFVVSGRGYNASTPIVEGGTLIYCGSGRGATAVKLELAGTTITATELWKNPDNSVMFNTPVLKNGFLYGLTANNDLFCLNARNGTTVWTAPSTTAAPASEAPKGAGGRGGRGGGGGMRGGGFGSVVDAGAVLLALTPASELIVFRPDEKAYSEIARLKVGGSPTHAHPVVSGKRIFIKDQESLALWLLP